MPRDSGRHPLPEAGRSHLLPRGLGSWHMALQYATGVWGIRDLFIPEKTEFLKEMTYCREGAHRELVKRERKACLRHL